MVVEELDVLSAIWILACNDENPILTYEGIRYRLNLPATYDVRALIRKRGELFRLGANPEAFEQWKGRMLSGKHLPAWIRVLRDQGAQQAQSKA